ncbi:MAG: class I SAM-dependent methyltransferase [Ignavibacteriaceae bacterium]
MQINYLKNLSKIHNEGFSEHSVKSFPFILKTINRFYKKGLIVELGCGSGITADKLIKNNYSVIGVDYSASMIELAKKNVPKVKFIVGSFHEIEIPKCVAVLAIGEVFNYNFDEKTNYKSKKENKSKKELERRIITFYKNKNGYKRNEEVHKIKLFRTAKIIRILQNIGFDTKFYRSYGNYKLRKNQTVIVSKK